MPLWTLVALVAAAAASPVVAPAQTPSSDELRHLLRKSLTGLNAESERKEQFLFKVQTERRELDAAGKILSETSYHWERIEIDGFSFGRTIERNGKALTARERADEEKAIQKRLAELKAPKLTTASMALPKPAAAPSRSQQQQQEWFQEFPDALEYRLIGEEMINGRLTLRLAASPRPGYQPRNMRARVFEKLRGDLWIDKATAELAKVDAEMFDTVSVGFGVLGKIEKGTRFRMQRRPVADNLWLIDSQTIRFGGRFLLFKSVRTEASTQWSDFRRRSAASVSAPGTRPGNP